MRRKAKKLLLILSKRRWVLKPPKGIRVPLIRLCIEQGLVKTRKVNRRRRKDGTESYRISISITQKGRKALKEGLNF